MSAGCVRCAQRRNVEKGCNSATPQRGDSLRLRAERAARRADGNALLVAASSLCSPCVPVRPAAASCRTSRSRSRCAACSARPFVSCVRANPADGVPAGPCSIRSAGGAIADSPNAATPRPSGSCSPSAKWFLDLKTERVVMRLNSTIRRREEGRAVSSRSRYQRA